MKILIDFSNFLSKLIGINQTFILLTIYSVLSIVFIELISRGIIFLNIHFSKNQKNLYFFNKKTHIIKFLLDCFVIFIIWEAQIRNLVTIISFVGAAATLAIRDIIINFFAGIYINIAKPFRIEDRIEINKMSGDVVNINTLNFEILEVSSKDEGEQSTGIIVQIPNSKIFSEPIKNYTKAFKYIWSELEVKIELNADLEKNKQVLYDIVKSNDIVKKIPNKMKRALNNSTKDYRIYYNNLEPIIYTRLTDEYVELVIRYLAHPKKARYIESSIWNKIYEKVKLNEIDLYIKSKVNKK